MPTDSSPNRWLDNNPLRVYRNKNGLSAQDLSEALGVPIDDINAWENGTGLPNNQNFALLADRLDIPTIMIEWKDWADRKSKG